MSLDIVPFEPGHVERMKLQHRQINALSVATGQYLFALKVGGLSATAMDGATVLACAGIVIEPFGSGTLWSFVSDEAGRHFVRLDRCVRRMLSIPRLRRIDATTEVGFAQGCRWLEMLGFENEGVMRKYGPDGADHYRYARVS